MYLCGDQPSGPSLGGRLLGDFRPSLRSGLCRTRGATLLAQCHGSRVLPLLLRRRRPILHLPGGDIDHHLGGLAEVSGSLGMLWGHGRQYRPSPLCAPPLSTAALFKLTHYPRGDCKRRWGTAKGGLMRKIGLAIGMTVAVGACAGRAPQPVAVVQPQDRYSDCAAITAEIEPTTKRSASLLPARPQGRSKRRRRGCGRGGLAAALCHGFSEFSRQGSRRAAKSPAIPCELGGAEMRYCRTGESSSGSQALTARPPAARKPARPILVPPILARGTYIGRAAFETGESRNASAGKLPF